MRQRDFHVIMPEIGQLGISDMLEELQFMAATFRVIGSGIENHQINWK